MPAAVLLLLTLPWRRTVSPSGLSSRVMRRPGLVDAERMTARWRLRSLNCVVMLALALAAAACNAPSSAQAPKQPTASTPPATPPSSSSRGPDATDRDLSVDESMGGHTLARHVGKTDAELEDRLRREPQISAASTYTDRATAEGVVGAALASAGDTLMAWQNRSGRRPNLVLHYVDRAKRPVGRSLARGHHASVPCDLVLVVLRWNERQDRFYVLTSYPEAER